MLVLGDYLIIYGLFTDGITPTMDMTYKMKVNGLSLPTYENRDRPT
ncbi:MAG: hypothetical protein HC796_00250 [Synechococcaceae cyanobacterium RL_1_2]|nr:hypothetical protein [Synechococcaceae cyanobacterium RL_1_2]